VGAGWLVALVHGGIYLVVVCCGLLAERLAHGWLLAARFYSGWLAAYNTCIGMDVQMDVDM
jgi:hypothetical protein